MSIGLIQRVCAGYRVPLFDILADTLPGGLSLFAGDPRQDEMIDQSRKPEKAKLFHADNLHLFSGNITSAYSGICLNGWMRLIRRS